MRTHICSDKQMFEKIKLPPYTLLPIIMHAYPDASMFGIYHSNMWGMRGNEESDDQIPISFLLYYLN